ncbi:MAG TPA: trypsin-like peptidase domain-containing protein [Anaerolineales bacterium]|nr:trypsin-like peptidase domain-containing protein [Anaerolineales bacterium]
MKRWTMVVVAGALLALACSSLPQLTLPDLATLTVVTPQPQVETTSRPNLPPLAPAVGLPSESTSSALSDLYQRVNPGVVSLRVFTAEGGALGSGFVVDKQGHIVTNLHVVTGATGLEVDFPSGQMAHGKVIAEDPDSDLAVILVTVPEAELVPLSLGDSSTLRVGTPVVAIGNPFGLSSTMTLGIVSGLGRTLDSERASPGGGVFSAADLIQTDAAVNPGNSGGPLLDLQGYVVGINRAIRSTSVTTSGDVVNSGVGFAISVNVVRRVLPSLIEKGAYDYPYIGITGMSELHLAEQEALGLAQSTGVYVQEVTAGSPAEQAGLRAGSRPTTLTGLQAGGDLIIAVNDIPLRNFADLLSYLVLNASPGDTVKLTLLRDGQQKEVSLTLAARP